MLSRAKEKLYTAVDIGTTATRVLVARVTSAGSPNVIACGVSPSRGVHKGMVVNLEETRESVRAAVEDTQLALGRPLPPAWVGVTGTHMQSYNASTTAELDYWERAVSREDVAQLVQSAEPRVVPQRQVVHIIPRAYTLDGLPSGRKPVGLYGQRLDVESHVVSGNTSHLDNVMAAVRKAGLQVRAMVLEPLASAEAILTADERQMGVLLVDIGGGTSDIALFQRGTIQHTAVIPVGGYQFTNDLCLALGIPFPTAESIKLDYGHVMPEQIDQSAMVEFPEPDREACRQVQRRHIARYFNDRAKELVQLIFHQAHRAGLERLPPGGVVLTGGTSKLPGLVDLIHQLSGVPVRTGGPRDTLGLPVELLDPSFATSVGILLWSVAHNQEQPLYPTSPRISYLIRRWTKWLPHPIPARGNSAA